MIRNINLSNWRAYSKLAMSFEPGITFIVAPNGVGKTSLVEATRFALFGDAAGRPDGAVRLGASTAIASVTVELPDGQLLTITRQLPRKLAKSRQPPVSADLAGQHLDEDALARVLRESFAADPAFLSRLTVLRGDAFRSSTQLNLRQHLCDYFGVGALQNAVDSLDSWIKQGDRDIRTIKQVNPVSPKRLKELREQVEAAAQEAKDEATQHDAAVTAAAAAEKERDDAVAYKEWQDRESNRLAALAALAARAQQEAVVSAEPAQLPTALDAADDELTESIDRARQAQAEADGRSGAFRTALEELDGTNASCPVCRRPMTMEDKAYARAAHLADLEALQSQARDHATELQALETRRTQIRKLRQEAHGLARAETPPREAAAAAASVLTEADDVRAAAFERLVNARAAATTSMNALQAAQQDTQADQLLRQRFREYALADATRRAIALATESLIKDTIAPLTDEISHRWKRLFPDRGGVDVSADGELTRSINGEVLPFSSFSGGEQVTAQLLMRLLVLETATRATFCWIDEPLEHLDPDTRRHVASLVTRVASTSPIRQVVLTTYEEPLAWALAQRAPDIARLMYVRAQAE